MKDIDPEYHQSLEDAVDQLMNLWLEPLDDDVEAEDFEAAENTCRKVLSGVNVKGLSANAEEIVIMKFTGVIARYRKKVRQESIIAKTSMIENRRLRSLLRKKGIEYE